MCMTHDSAASRGWPRSSLILGSTTCSENDKVSQEIKHAYKIWWDRWWEADWSWLGLRDKQVGVGSFEVYGGVHGCRNVQDYWRRDPKTGSAREDEAMIASGELIRDPDGRLWHLSHVPLAWRDETLAKISWDSLQRRLLSDLITDRINAGIETPVDKAGLVKGLDGRAQLLGVIFADRLEFNFEEGYRVNAIFDMAFFHDVNFAHCLFASGLSLVEVYCSGSANMEKLISQSALNLHGATFILNINLSDAQIMGNIYISDAAFFEYANLRGISCLENFYGKKVKFTRDAVFSGGKFEGNLNLEEGDFSMGINISEVNVSGVFCIDRSFISGTLEAQKSVFKNNFHCSDTTFDIAKFNDVDFAADFIGNNCVFQLSFGFNEVKIDGFCSFSKSKFLGYSSFSDSKFLREVSLAAVEFNSYALFSGSIFEGSVKFADSIFGGQLRSHDKGAVNRFSDCRFRGVADFSRAVFKFGASFTANIFERPVYFQSTEFPRELYLRQGCFAQTQFKEIVIFTGNSSNYFSIFEGAIFNVPIQLEDLGDIAAWRQFYVDLGQARRTGLLRTQFVALPSTYIAEWLTRPTSLQRGDDRSLRQIESACRILKQNMEKLSDKGREQMFFSFELIARRHRSGVSLWERAFSFIYEITSKFGQSLSRPILMFLAIIPIFAILYMYIFYFAGREIDKSVILQCFGLSIGRVFPFGLMNINTSEYHLTVLGQGDTIYSFALRVLATLQSLIALAFAFLLGLALRRRFQIN